MQVISATELARNTREVLDKVARTGQPLAVERNHTLVAHITPAQPAVTVAQALAGLPGPMFSTLEGARWLEESRQGLLADDLRDPWA
jgi:antitoxin (DNA-binding transcriptional repressor) of toxin-antitoxin stability system